MPISQAEGYFQNPYYRFFRTYVFSVRFKMKALKKAFSSVKKKTNPNFVVTLAEKPSIFTVYLMNHIYQTSVSLICDNTCNGMYRT